MALSSEPSSHILRNGSGSIRLKVDDVFGDTLTDAEKRALATLIYYPREKAKLALSQVEDEYAWYAVTVPRLVAVCKRAARKYCTPKSAEPYPSEFAYIVEELLTEDRMASTRKPTIAPSSMRRCARAAASRSSKRSRP